MTLSLKHSANVVVADDGTSPVGSDDWNAEHTTSLATNKLVGRGSAGTGAWEEISLGTNLSYTGTTLNAAGGGGSPGGSDTQIQFNDGGAFGAESGLTFNKTTDVVTAGHLVCTCTAGGYYHLVYFDGNRNINMPGSTTMAFGEARMVAVDTLAGALYLGGMGGSGVSIYGDGANVLSQRASAAAQAFRVYNTYTDGSNYERGVFDWTTAANVLTIGSQSAGTGTARNVALATIGGTVEINNGTTGTYRDLKLRSIERTGRVIDNVVTLTDGATVALDAALGNVFRLVAAGDRTISAPTNKPAAGQFQKIVIRHEASGANRTLTLTTGSAGAFRFGTDFTSL